MGQEFIGFLGSCVDADGMVHVVPDGEGYFGVSAIDGAGGGIDQVRYLQLPAGLQDIGKAQDVGLDINQGVLQAVPHPGLGCQVHNPFCPGHPEDPFDPLPILQANPFEMELRILPEQGQAVLLQPDVVIVVKIVKANDGMALC